MSRNNTRIMDAKDLELFLNKYYFDIDEKYVYVKLKDYGRVTAHERGKSFFIQYRGLRKLTITPEAVEIWNELVEKQKKLNLIEVQQYVNILTLTYQKVNTASVKHMLNGYEMTVKNL